MKTAVLAFALLPCAATFLLSTFLLSQTVPFPGPGKVPVVAGCTAPTGTHFTETWGDSATSCWASGPSSCNQTWTIGAGTAHSIVSSPASAPANTACSNSLQMNLPASAAWLGKTFTAIATSFDVTGTIYVNTPPATSNAGLALCLTTNAAACDSATVIAALFIDNNSTCSGLGFRAYGGVANSACIAYSANTWYTFDLHKDTTLASCSLSINGGTAQTFTCNSGNAAQIYVGTKAFGSTAMEYTIGNVSF